MAFCRNCAVLGSPPRMRGKGRNLARGVRPDRITPAYAGKSRIHRACTDRHSGSPPRMRGKGCAALPWGHPYRITPAYAGKSRPETTLKQQQGDHPRVCGEKSMHKAKRRTKKGSPPRMRGKAWFIPFPVRKFGITPAYAGKSCIPAPSRSRSRDHPRVCGEKNLTLNYEDMQKGSPPRMRGKAFW